MLDCKDCCWSNADTCRNCKQEETKKVVDLADAIREASEKGLVTTYSAARLEGTFKEILDKINGREGK